MGAVDETYGNRRTKTKVKEDVKEGAVSALLRIGYREALNLNQRPKANRFIVAGI